MHHCAICREFRGQGQPAGEGGGRVDHITPDLIAQHPEAPTQAEAGQGLEFVAPEAATQRIVGIAEAEHPGTRGHQRRQCLQIQGRLAIEPPQHRHASCAADRVAEQEVDRIGHDRLVPGGQPVVGQQGQTGRRTVHRHDTLGRHGGAPPAQITSHRLPEVRQSARGAVTEHAAVAIANDGLSDHRGGGEIRIGGGQRNHAVRLLGPAQVVGPLAQQVQGYGIVPETGTEAIGHATRGSWHIVGEGWTNARAILRPASTQSRSVGSRCRS